MKRKIALTIHAVVEFLMIITISVLYAYEVFSVTTLVAVVVSISVISGAIQIVISRKFPPAE